jgi:ribonuclease HI
MIANLDRIGWKINFSWVKAHAGNYGNETADRLAKEAARAIEPSTITIESQ